MADEDRLARVVTGRCEAYLVDSQLFACRLHRGVEAPLLALCERARAAGFDLAVASGYRSFARQQLIWNQKALGQRRVLDDDEQPISLQSLGKWQQVEAILRWSALPGASRHHWGTDIDVYDRAALGEHYGAPQLTLTECAVGGIFADFHSWLEQILEAEPELGFFRPYRRDCGGVACEPWHLSYQPIAAEFERLLSPDLLARCIREEDIVLGETALLHLDEIYRRFVRLPA